MLAKRIIAGRPYKSIEELEKVSGIGKATIEKLRPHVGIGEAAP
ncbi:MAG TPA: helix-hairpin-helix domain-containing protein [Verrucomicrobiota bacterium]|nr:helix-hairpin-helix domain-containing protein [Verrucomicrobiota bacterium]